MRKIYIIIILMFMLIPTSVAAFSPAPAPAGIYVEIDSCNPRDNPSYTNMYDFDILVLRSEMEELIDETLFDEQIENSVSYTISNTDWPDRDATWISARRYLDSNFGDYVTYDYNKCGFEMFSEEWDYGAAKELFDYYKIVVFVDGEYYVSDMQSTSNLYSYRIDIGIKHVFYPDTNEFGYYMHEYNFNNNTNPFDVLAIIFLVIVIGGYVIVFGLLEPIVYLIGNQPKDGILVTFLFNILACGIAITLGLLSLTDPFILNYLGVLLLAGVYVGKHYAIKNLLPGVSSVSIALGGLNVTLLLSLILMFSRTL